MTTFSLRVGKIRTTAPKFPSEPGYVASVNAQLGDLKAAVQSILDQLENVAPSVCLDAVMPTFDLSQTYCPYDTGALRGSGYAAITGTANGGRVEVGYAKGGNPFYAVFVHENMSFYHKPPTRSKWLQAAMLEDLMNIWSRLQEGYRSFVASGSK